MKHLQHVPTGYLIHFYLSHRSRNVFILREFSRPNIPFRLRAILHALNFLKVMHFTTRVTCSENLVRLSTHKLSRPPGWIKCVTKSEDTVAQKSRWFCLVYFKKNMCKMKIYYTQLYVVFITYLNG